MSLRSPLSKVLGLGAAKQGAHHWWVQRVNSVALLLLAPWFLLSLISLGDISYASLVFWVASPMHSILLALFVATTAYHTQLGLQVVVEDYVNHKGTRTVLLMLINFALLLLAVIAVWSILRMALNAPAIQVDMRSN